MHIYVHTHSPHFSFAPLLNYWYPCGPQFILSLPRIMTLEIFCPPIPWFWGLMTGSQIIKNPFKNKTKNSLIL